MKRYFRTDLACETADELRHIEGTKYEKFELDASNMEKLEIITPEASKRLGRQIGAYITFFTERIWLFPDESISLLACEIAAELRNMIRRVCNKEISRDTSVLVVGLGNSYITADALGPDALNGITVTRHIKLTNSGLYDSIGLCNISALAPGVLGKTGMESAELVLSAVRQISPDAVIVIDALAAGSIERLATTVQLSDTGIDPGAGIGNHRQSLSKATLGVPVISIGIPTVVDSSTLIYDAFQKARIHEVPQSLREHLENSRGYYVTPKESDMINERASLLISSAINTALVI